MHNNTGGILYLKGQNFSADVVRHFPFKSLRVVCIWNRVSPYLEIHSLLGRFGLVIQTEG